MCCVCEFESDGILSFGGTISRGQVIDRKCDGDGTPVGRDNENLILDSRHFLVVFEDGEVTEITTNIIAESTYAICDPEGERVLLFDCILDFKHDRNAITLTKKKFVEYLSKDHNYSLTKV